LDRHTKNKSNKKKAITKNEYQAKENRQTTPKKRGREELHRAIEGPGTILEPKTLKKTWGEKECIRKRKTVTLGKAREGREREPGKPRVPWDEKNGLVKEKKGTIRQKGERTPSGTRTECGGHQGTTKNKREAPKK